MATDRWSRAIDTGQRYDRVRVRPAARASLLLAIVLGAGLVCSGLARARDAYDWRGLLEAASGQRDARAMLMQATAYLNLGDVVQALRVIDELGAMGAQHMVIPVLASCGADLVSRPADLPLLYCMAAGHFTLNQTDAALHHLDRIVGLDPASPWPLVLMALAQLSGDDLAGARASAGRALAVDPGNQYAHLILSQVCLRERDYWGFMVHYVRAPDASREMLSYLRNKEASTSPPAGS